MYVVWAGTENQNQCRIENEIGIQASSHEGMHAKLRKLNKNAEPMGAAAKNTENKTNTVKQLVPLLVKSSQNIERCYQGEPDEDRAL